MTDNPYQSPIHSDDLGELIAEYRVSRIIFWSSVLLFLCAAGLFLLVVTEILAEKEGLDVFAAFCVISILLLITAGSALVAATAGRSRLAVFHDGLVHANAFRAKRFRYADIAEMRVSSNLFANLGKTLNPLKPHLVISIGSPVQKRYYLCPFLLSQFGLFETAVNAWRESNGTALLPEDLPPPRDRRYRSLSWQIPLLFYVLHAIAVYLTGPDVDSGSIAWAAWGLIDAPISVIAFPIIFRVQTHATALAILAFVGGIQWLLWGRAAARIAIVVLRRGATD